MKLKQTAPLLLLAVIWGCYYVASHRAVEGLSVFSVGIVIRFVTMLLLGSVMWKKGELPQLLKTKGVLKRLVLIGTLGFLLDITAFIGLTLSPAGSGTALLKCDILFVNIISVLIYKERFTKRDWLYTIVMLFGVLMVMGVDVTEFKLSGKGDIFFVLSALFVSINAFVIKSVQLDKKAPTIDNVVAFYNNFITMILFFGAAAVMGTLGQLTELSKNPGTFAAVLLAGVGQTLVYIVYYYNLRRFPVWIVKVFLLLMPIVSTIVSFILFGETLISNQYIGMMIVLAGAFGVLMEQKRKSKIAEEMKAGVRA
ncbi:DMT family transporter [Anaerobium acetethylicum]|uniref:Permease of the drug/metabolite transporter (DMT) superfamily n=1 Tax=Anaerobium acetethylicum TaxID=1619234 RepID=A0A1D3TV07_9FIRM|nr:DMT family transporter [Anaerobium acetethylicum]SCP97958.1 Permease of the drug/metabolite transporter (DMT) superfamily [Anaerobium acetethylicum]